MRHRIADDVNVKVEFVDISTDVEDLIDKITDSAITIIAAVTVSKIVTSYFKGDRPRSLIGSIFS